MSDERKQVLEMLTEGKISVEDADRLLDKLSGSQHGATASTPNELAPRENNVRTPKYLRVVMGGTSGDKVNIRVPLMFVKTGLKLTTMMPKQAAAQLAEEGIDLSHLSELKGDELMQALHELNVDIESAEGESVRVFCE